MGSRFVLAAGSGVVVWLSRGSLTRRRTHGFYRFFALEAILGLIMSNAAAWFRKPLSVRQLASWVLLLLSFGLATHAFWLLRHEGRPDQSIPDGTRQSIEKTTRLVRVGAYRFIRHPLYASLIALAWGAHLKAPSPRAWLLAAIATVAAYLSARVEEDENVQIFEDEYIRYMRQTGMFLPLVHRPRLAISACTSA